MRLPPLRLRFLSLLVLSLTFSVGGCREEPRVEILWDHFGVPHIFSPSAEGLFEAHGWAQMRSHGDLILRLYGQARGRASEYWGADYLDSDIWVRTNGIPERARGWYLTQDAEMSRYLEAFARGMNAYAQEHADALDDEVEVVLPVDPSDVLGHFLQAIHFTFVSSSRLVPGSLRAGLLEETLGHPIPGSNGWAIGPGRSESGNAMLLANPHLSWGGLFTWFESHLVGPDFNAYGATLVGMPLVTIGFTENVAWTHTVNTYDGADVFELALEGEGYLYDGQVRAFDTREDTILIRSEDGSVEVRTLEVRRSFHGPVVGMRGEKAYALRVAGLEAAGVVRQYYEMLRARGLEEFQEAMSRLQMPMFTTLYADREGHIMHLFNGLVPRRSQGDVAYWSGVVPGDVSKTLWTEYHPFQDLPRVVDPESGWLQNANDPPWTTTFPAAIRPGDFPPYMAPEFMHPRAQRSARMLLEDGSITFQELISYKHSTRVELADILLEELLPRALAHDRAEVRAAAQVLDSWDRTADAASRGGVLFVHWAEQLFRRTNWEPYRTPWSPERPLETPEGIADMELAVDLLAAAADTIRARYGELAVPFGEVYRVRRDGLDLPGNGHSDPLGVFRASWWGPDQDHRFAQEGGDSFVLAVEFSDPLRAMAVLGYGNESQAGSSHRTDQLELFSRKEMRPVLWSREDIEANLEAIKIWPRTPGQ